MKMQFWNFDPKWKVMVYVCFSCGCFHNQIYQYWFLKAGKVKLCFGVVLRLTALPPCRRGARECGHPLAHGGCARRYPSKELKNLLTAHLLTCRRFHYGEIRNNSQSGCKFPLHKLQSSLPWVRRSWFRQASAEVLHESWSFVCVCVCVLPRLLESTRETSVKRVTGFDINQQDCIAAIIRQ